MDKGELSQVYWLEKEIEIWEEELRRRKERSKVKSPMKFKDGSGEPGQKSVEEEDIVTNVEIDALIRRKQTDLERQRDKILEYIIGIEDSQMRLIVYWRCVKLCPWRVVAKKVGGANTEEGVRQAFHRHFK